MQRAEPLLPLQPPPQQQQLQPLQQEQPPPQQQPPQQQQHVLADDGEANELGAALTAALAEAPAQWSPCNANQTSDGMAAPLPAGTPTAPAPVGPDIEAGVAVRTPTPDPEDEFIVID
jgi:hypothetical protein